jgi:hypothetical protein
MKEGESSNGDCCHEKRREERARGREVGEGFRENSKGIMFSCVSSRTENSRRQMGNNPLMLI